MLCPLRFRGQTTGMVLSSPKDFECVRECAWLIQDPMTNSFSCSIAVMSQDCHGIPYVTLDEQFPRSNKLTG